MSESRYCQACGGELVGVGPVCGECADAARIEEGDSYYDLSGSELYGEDDE